MKQQTAVDHSSPAKPIFSELTFFSIVTLLFLVLGDLTVSISGTNSSVICKVMWQFFYKCQT